MQSYNKNYFVQNAGISLRKFKTFYCASLRQLKDHGWLPSFWNQLHCRKAILPTPEAVLKVDLSSGEQSI